jgi:hypothetical protein
LNGRRFGRCFTYLCRAFVALVFAGQASAQSESGSGTLTGIVRDASGAVVTGVTVTARHTATDLIRTATTDDAGRFRLPALPVGPYVVEATAQGFQLTKYEGINLTVGKTESVSLTLTPGAVTESVTGDRGGDAAGSHRRRDEHGHFAARYRGTARSRAQLCGIRPAVAERAAGVRSVRPGDCRAAVNQLERGD